MMMGVADMPIQTLKLLNIHPDARAESKKGKEKAKGSESSSHPGDSVLPDRSAPQRTATGVDPVMGNESKPPAQTQRFGSGKSSMPDIPVPEGRGSPLHRSTFMADAFSASAQGSRSPSRERGRLLSPGNCSPKRKNSASSADLGRAETGTSSNFTENLKNMQMDSTVDTGKGIARIVGASFKSPMDFSLNVAKGFHNVPKLYGGEVRKVDNVTDFKSGLTTAAKVNLMCKCVRI